MLSNIKRAFKAYTKGPFNFAWASLLACVFYGVAVLAALGVFLVFFMTIAAFNHYAINDPITIVVGAIIIILLKLLTGGVNAALAQAYSDASNGKKTGITEFYMKALKSAPSAFAITLIRDIIWLIIIIPIVLLYVFALKGVQYIEIVVGLYALFTMWLIHMLFTPALLSSALTGAGVFSSLKQGFRILKKKHAYFAGAYIVFAITWLLNFIPILQILSIFVLFPISYGTLITFVEGGKE